ncbi:hypothetical protein AAH972_14195, partial [Enterococcus faecalis]
PPRYTPTRYRRQRQLCIRARLEGNAIKVHISAISNGIDLSPFYPSEENEQKFREYFKIDEENKVIICVGLFFERKGITDFIEVARELPDYNFIFFGDK